MTEALWLSIAAAVVATAGLTAASLLLSKRSAARIDRMVAEARESVIRAST